ncbi:MAG: glycoside hydrolase family 2 TIM barrel-domain containing protein [Clostridia bacterium]|nr:glycoside hydrolase family 2 TIM barrel-domain containing protein [Clostridia bacterium]
MRVHLNNNWQFSREESFEHFEEVRLPHTNVILPYSYIDEQDYQFIAFYRTLLDVPEEWMGKNLLLTFGAVAHESTVYINGLIAGTHNCGYSSFTLDITSYIKVGINSIAVRADSRESLNIPPFGMGIDYLTYGGIYREVYLDVLEQYYIQEIFVKGYSIKQPYNFCAEITLNQFANDLSIRYQLHQEGEKLNASESVSTRTTTVFACIDNVKLWDINSPNLAFFTVLLYQGDRLIDSKEVRFGFRDVLFTTKGFLLNGIKIDLIGLNRHQSFPYVGYAMPSRPQRNDARILKQELGVNIVRTSHYPQSQDFIDACDELGLLVFTEIAGWNHIGDEHWQNVAIDNTADMVKQYRNHPSIVCWGVRINESQDNDNLYLRTNATAHQLDDSRQTAGVRYIQHSRLLEDIYSYNDFTYNGGKKTLFSKRAMCRDNAPMLVTEYLGHMYPTKSYDNESRRTQHALRHMTMIDACIKANHLCGGIGWCMADYNTHKQFGSQDKICYHGVMDMFRNPKLASYAYASQSTIPVLEILSTMNGGEWDTYQLPDIYAFTNADSVRLYRNGHFIKQFYPDHKHYVGVKHPPICIDDCIGDTLQNSEKLSHRSAERVKKCIKHVLKNGYTRLSLSCILNVIAVCIKEKLKVSEVINIGKKYVVGWGTGSPSYTFEAIKDGIVVKSVVKETVDSISLWAEADSTQLIDEDCYDVASVRIKAVDKYGNVLPLCNIPLHLSVEGNAQIIGSSDVSLQGGYSGTYVKTTGKGNARLLIKSEFGTRTIDFYIK